MIFPKNHNVHYKLWPEIIVRQAWISSQQLKAHNLYKFDSFSDINLTDRPIMFNRARSSFKSRQQFIK